MFDKQIKSYTVIVRNVKHNKNIIRRKSFGPNDYYDAQEFAKMVESNYKNVYKVEFQTNYKKVVA
jgi:hypothetical protein